MRGSEASPRPRAVITGLGIASCAGLGVEPFLRAIERGEGGGRLLRHVAGPSGQPRLGAALPEADSSETSPRDRTLRMAELAVEEALLQAGWAPGALPEANGLIVGTTLGCVTKAQRWHAELLARRRPRSADLLRAPLHTVADRLADRFGLDGIRTVVTNACVSATTALGLALDLIRSGEAELVVAGGADSLHTFNFTGFAALGMLTRGRCVPFDRSGRSKMLLGEAAAFLVIESETSARQRGANILAELAGYGSACDAFHAISPRSDGAATSRAMEMALADAALSPQDVDFVALHGVGTHPLDSGEVAALRRVFEARRSELPVASLRPVTGHTLGSVGAVDAIACVLAIQRGFVPPTGAEEDGESSLPPPAELRRTRLVAPIRVALKTSSGFGGMNAALVLRQWAAES